MFAIFRRNIIEHIAVLWFVGPYNFVFRVEVGRVEFDFNEVVVLCSFSYTTDISVVLRLFRAQLLIYL